ncbi:MAG TPA: NUDIX domain-containing protein [Candidatus Acidoferrales bacterium]|nr:NUDIX domain-containing protein [Candidatus Acidoferrales bacterium]
MTTQLIEDRELEVCPDCGFVHWRDPKVVTMVVVEDAQGGVVVGRRATTPGYGLWCLPGGYVNDDEHPALAARRECREEILAEVEITGLIDIYHIPTQSDQSNPAMLALAYSGRLLAADFGAGPEMLEVRSFAPSTLPELVFWSHAQALRDWLSHPKANNLERT